MAGILDWLGGGLLPSRPSDWGGAAPKQVPQDWRDAANYLWQLDRMTAANPLTGNQTFAIDQAQPQADTFSQRFGAMQPPAAQPQQAPAPQIQSPAQARQAFAMPDSTYAFGGQMVPTFGQAQPMSDEVSARPRGQSPVPVNAPQVQAPS